MKRTIIATLSLAAISICLCGCPNGKPSGPVGLVIKDGITTITLSADSKTEVQAATAVEVARMNYIFYLNALHENFKQTGDVQKQTWADRELQNLLDAHTIQWRGMDEIVAPSHKSLAKADENLLVEWAVSAREDYLRTVENLMSVYKSREILNRPRAEAVERIQDGFDPVRTYMYYLSAEIPASNLRAVQTVPEADKLFEQGLKFYKDGTSALSTFIAIGKTQRRQALEAFLKLVRSYPTSAKIGRSAFYIAELYRRCDEPARAAVWYDRACEWDDRLVEPARYKAATLYDYKLGDLRNALKYYKLTIKHEKKHEGNVENARKRIKEIEADQP